jgi:hypothetical protein
MLKWADKQIRRVFGVVQHDVPSFFEKNLPAIALFLQRKEEPYKRPFLGGVNNLRIFGFHLLLEVFKTNPRER